jgi:hypothetical protein
LPAAQARRITHLSDFVDDFQLARDLDAVLYGTGDRAGVSVEAEHPLYLSPILFFSAEVKELRYPLSLS